jgi:hypothetical protein
LMFLAPSLQASATCACRCARQELSRVLLSTLISIGAVREIIFRGAIQRREVREVVITYALYHAI